MRHQTAWLSIVVLFLALGTYYALVNPPFESPDEVWHFAYVREITKEHGFPVVAPNATQPWSQEGTQAPLYYLLGAPLVAWIPGDMALPTPNPFARIGEPQAATNDNRNAFLHPPEDTSLFQGTALALHLLRLYSVALGAVTVALTFALAREIFPEPSILAIAAAAFVAFLPQFVFISSSVNNDNLATLLSTAMLWQLARGLRRGITLKRAALLGAIAGAALLTKFNTVTLIPLAVFAIAIHAVPKRAWHPALLNIGIVVLVVALISGWWYARNLLLYGDLSGLSLIIKMIGERSAPIGPLRWFLSENQGLRLSTWGVFGWMNVLAPPPFYSFFDLLALGGIIGILVAVLRRRAWSWGAAMLALWCVIVFAELVYYNLSLPAAQGRLLFPALAAWAVLWARGIVTLVPRRITSYGVVLLGAAQLLVACITPALVIAPAYTPTDLAALPADAIRMGAAFANGAQILGARIDRTELQPGGTFDVTVYTSIAQPQLAHAALFVHLVSSNDIIVAQRDSAIASGNWGGLADPIVVADSMRMQIPVTAPAPDEWHVEVGMYDWDNRVRWVATGTGRDAYTIASLPVHPVSTSWGFDFAGKTVLDGAEITPRSGKAGSTLRVVLHWQTAPAGYRVFMHALGDADHIWASADEPLARAMPLVLHFAPESPPGVYPLEIGVYPLDGDRVPVYDARGVLLGDRLFLGPVRITP